MAEQNRSSMEQEREELRERIAQLDKELAAPSEPWQPPVYYTAYYATAGFLLGMFGAATSLLFNVVGSALFEQYPLRLVQVYLTFPLGARALELEAGPTLTIGCCLYIATGMLLGVPFHLLLTRFTRDSSTSVRFVVASALSLSMWLVHYYVILNYLQPALFGGNWIVEEIPWWVGGSTHLVFGWTMALLYPWGLYSPYRLQTEQPAAESLS